MVHFLNKPIAFCLRHLCLVHTLAEFKNNVHRKKAKKIHEKFHFSDFEHDSKLQNFFHESENANQH